MRTVLDEAKTWVVDEIIYGDELRVIVREVFRSEAPQDLRVSEAVTWEVYPLEVTEASRRFAIRFPHFVAWQVVDESFTTFDDCEECDGMGFLQILERSKYFDYVKANHGWFTDVVGPARHYRLWTEDEVIDVVGCQSPVIEPWKNT